MKMAVASPFERAIMRLRIHNGGQGLTHFLGQFDDIKDVLNLRAVCRSLANIKAVQKWAFGTIYVHAPARGEKSTDVLATIGPECSNLVIRLAYPEIQKPKPWYQQLRTSAETLQQRAANRKASHDRETQDGDFQIQEDHNNERPHKHGSASCNIVADQVALHLVTDMAKPEPPAPIAWKFVIQRRPNQLDHVRLAEWQALISHFGNIQTLTIACNGDPAWNGCTDIEMTLIYLRLCIERINPKKLHTLLVSPIHAMGILHIRWAGLGAYGEAPGTTPPIQPLQEPTSMIWQKLRRLELRIRNPYAEGRLIEQQKALFEKVLADYIRSFRPTLAGFKFGWIDCKHGPNPLLLGKDLEEQYTGQSKSWARLEEVWLENVLVNEESITAIKAIAPGVRRIMVHRSRIARSTADIGRWRNLLHISEAGSLADNGRYAISDSGSGCIPIMFES